MEENETTIKLNKRMGYADVEFLTSRDSFLEVYKSQHSWIGRLILY